MTSDYTYYVPDHINEGDMCVVDVPREPGGYIVTPSGWESWHYNSGSKIYRMRWSAGRPRKYVFKRGFHPSPLSYYEDAPDISSEPEDEVPPEEFKHVAAFGVMSKQVAEAMRNTDLTQVKLYYRTPGGVEITAELERDWGPMA
jgi:hypothetical protein